MTVDVLDLSGSLAFVDEMYQQFRADPASVDPSWAAAFGAPAAAPANGARTSTLVTPPSTKPVNGHGRPGAVTMGPLTATAIASAWPLEYKTSFVWDKIKHNMGHYNSVRHEFLLVCTRGYCNPDNRVLFDSVVSIERGEHSVKPDYFREIIEKLYIYGNKIELFAREAAAGWDVFGNQRQSNV